MVTGGTSKTSTPILRLRMNVGLFDLRLRRGTSRIGKAVGRHKQHCADDNYRNQNNFNARIDD